MTCHYPDLPRVLLIGWNKIPSGFNQSEALPRSGWHVISMEFCAHSQTSFCECSSGDPAKRRMFSEARTRRKRLFFIPSVSVTRIRLLFASVLRSSFFPPANSGKSHRETLQNWRFLSVCVRVPVKALTYFVRSARTVRKRWTKRMIEAPKI